MKDSITFRVDSEKKNILRAAESLHLSMSEYIEKALDNEGTRKDKKEAIPQLIEIRNKFESTCDECGRTMKREEFILWSKGVAICSDCGINASSNKHYWNAQRKEREIVKALEEARERLNIANLEMDEKEALKKSIKRLEKIYENQCELHKENMEFLRVALGTSREKEVIEKVNNIADDLIPLVADLKQERESKLRRKVKPKKAKKKEGSRIMITNEMWERVYADSVTVQDLLIKLLNETNDTAPEDSLTKLKHFIEEYKNLYKILWRIKANSILHEEKKPEEKES